MKTVFELIEANGLTLHGDIEHFAELIRADERNRAMRENAYVLAEREACAEAVRFADNGTEAAEIIRARGEHMTKDERNFCPRCGKRTADLTTIHTCTPPQENT